MRFKHGVKWPADMHASMWHARGVADQVHYEMTGEEATCTSAHRPGDPKKHGSKEALDLRTWKFGDPNTDLGKASVRKFAEKLRWRLGPDYDVVIEGPAAESEKYKDRDPHLHVEYDPREWAL